jgi:hypothetical protein
MISLAPTKSCGEDIWQPQRVRRHDLFSVTFLGSPTTYKKEEIPPREIIGCNNYGFLVSYMGGFRGEWYFRPQLEKFWHMAIAEPPLAAAAAAYAGMTWFHSELKDLGPHLG